ncbi:MAG: hypothetical protein KTR25_10900, partial [Myxococcales bacterium]|nr:hypothetical protein [Myxococcales bacterium]
MARPCIKATIHLGVVDISEHLNLGILLSYYSCLNSPVSATSGRHWRASAEIGWFNADWCTRAEIDPFCVDWCTRADIWGSWHRTQAVAHSFAVLHRSLIGIPRISLSSSLMFVIVLWRFLQDLKIS